MLMMFLSNWSKDMYSVHSFRASSVFLMTYLVSHSQHQVECTSETYLTEVWTGPSFMQYLECCVEVIVVSGCEY